MELSYNSIKELADEAVSQLPKLDNQLPLIRYYRSAASLLQQAKVYEIENDLETTYILLFRYAELMIKVIPGHKEYKDKDKCAPEKKSAKSTVIQILDKLENIKKTLNDHYKEKQRKREEEEAVLLQQQLLHQQQLQFEQTQLQNTIQAVDHHMNSNAFPANENPSFHNLLKEQQLLEKQQRVEYDKISPSVPLEKNASDVQYLLPEYKFSSSAPTLPPTPKPSIDVISHGTGVSSTFATESISLHNEMIEPSAPPSSDISTVSSNSISSQQIALSPQLPQIQPSMPPSQTQQSYATYQPMQYASIPNTQQKYGMTSTFPQHPQQPSMYQQPLFIPQPQMGFPISMLPMMPQQVPMNPTAPPAHLIMGQSNLPVQQTTVKQPLKPVENATPAPKKEINGLRQMIIDGEIFTGFIELASYNTKRNIETCGILAGSLKQNVLYVTHVIIPKQEGSSDTCAMVNEEEVFEYQEKNSLLTFGWIHTHPNHDCFLSSVDMHTHCSYQFLLKEAVAVVVAPNASPNFGIFSLTDPYGLTSIQACPLKGFHPHDRGLYKTCAHVNIRKGSPSYRVVDLR